MVVVVGAASFLMAFCAIKTHDASESRAEVYEKVLFDKKKILGGKNESIVGGDIISDDGVIGNPKKYPPSRKCAVMLCVLLWWCDGIYGIWWTN